MDKPETTEGKDTARAARELSPETLDACVDADGRKKVAADTGVSEGQLFAWVSVVELMRIPGVTIEYVQLLQASGVHTLLDLRERRADRLADALTELNVERGLVATVPPAAIIALWIEEATKMAAKLR